MLYSIWQVITQIEKKCREKNEVRYMLKVFLLSSSSLTILMVKNLGKKDILIFGSWKYKVNGAWIVQINVFNEVIKKNFIYVKLYYG